MAKMTPPKAKTQMPGKTGKAAPKPPFPPKAPPKFAKGGTVRGMGAATKGGKYSAC